MENKTIVAIEQTIGYEFRNKALISQAFTRSSYHFEHLDVPSNENLEFVGDSVLSLAVTNYLLTRYTQIGNNGLISRLDQNDFSDMRSHLVNQSFLSGKMSKLNLQSLMLMSVGDKKQDVENVPSVLEDLFESIVGAIYIDTGNDLTATENVVWQLLEIEKELDENENNIVKSYKNEVERWCVKYNKGNKPKYIERQQNGEFEVTCVVDEYNVSAVGFGKNKREAEKIAAELLYAKLKKLVSSLAVTSDQSEDAVSALNIHCQKNKITKPQYIVIADVTLADNSHEFTVDCRMENTETRGVGKKKNEACRQAAAEMLKRLNTL